MVPTAGDFIEDLLGRPHWRVTSITEAKQCRKHGKRKVGEVLGRELHSTSISCYLWVPADSRS